MEQKWFNPINWLFTFLNENDKLIGDVRSHIGDVRSHSLNFDKFYVLLLSSLQCTRRDREMG